MSEAANVAGCEAILSLLTWAPSGSNAAETEDLQDALCYTNQAVIGVAEPFIPDLAKIICSAQRARHCFDEIEQGGGAVPEALSRNVDQLEASLQALQSRLTPDQWIISSLHSGQWGSSLLPRKVVFVTFPLRRMRRDFDCGFGRRAAGVARLLAELAPTVLRIVGDGTDEISAVVTDGVDAVLAQVNHDLGFSGALRLARSLRTSRFFRGAIFLLVPDAAANEDGELRERFREPAQGVYLYDPEWNIYADRLPPRDIAALQEFLEGNLTMAREDWRRFCLIGIRELCDELVRLNLWLTPDTVVNEPELRESIERASHELRSARGDHSPIKEVMQRMLLAPEFSDRECSQLLKLVSAGEAQVPKTDQSLHGALHKLKNDLILPRKDEIKVQGNIHCLRQRADALVRIADDWPKLLGVARRVRDGLDGDVGSLHDPLSELQRWSLANNPNRTESSHLCYIERILVVDDHATWRERVAEVQRDWNQG